MRRRQQIGQVELLGAVAPYLSLPDLLRGRDIIHFVDNTSAVAALTKGFSRVPDSARIVHAFHAWCAGARARVWFEYVASDANPSDTPSRELELAGELFYPAPGVCSTPVPLLFEFVPAARALV